MQPDVNVPIRSGFIAFPKFGPFQHKFGGEAWSSTNGSKFPVPPTLLMTLDLADPRLSDLTMQGLTELPLFSFINCDAWYSRQDFRLIPSEKTVEVAFSCPTACQTFDVEDRLPLPLPEKNLDLRAMKPEEVPLDNADYWTACDAFVGGDSFLRVLGPPLWLEDPVETSCQCGKPAEYVASIGYESLSSGQTLLSGTPFFFGEGALYFFLCAACKAIIVISQST